MRLLDFGQKSGGWIRVQAVIALIAGMSSFETGAALAKNLFGTFSAEQMVGLRVCLAAVMLLLLVRPRIEHLTRANLKLFFPYGAAMAMMNFFFYIAISRLPLGLAVTIEFIGPLSLALFGSRRWTDIFWAMIVVLGLFLILRPDKSFHDVDPIGVAAALCSAVGWMIYLIAGTRVSKVVPGAQAAAIGMTLAGILLLPCFIIALPTAFANPSASVTAICIAVLSSAIPYLLEIIAMRRLNPRELGILLSLEPAFGSFSGIIFLGEALNLTQWMGIICVMGASTGNVLARQGKQSPSITLKEG